MVIIGLLGFSSGLPLLLTLSVLSYWLSQIGVEKSSIGLFALVSVPYSFKFLWSPFIDKLPIPVLSKKFGQRRAWALFCQAILMVAIIAMGFTNPEINPLHTAILALIVAFASASQDIVIDALRIELLQSNQQGAGAAMSVGGYRLGMLLAGGGSLIMSDFIGWPVIFAINGLFILFGMVAVYLCPEPDETPPKYKNLDEFWHFTIIEPFKDFFTHKNALLILIFIILYKYGDAFSGVMANPFYHELGFSGTEIGSITKFMGLIMTISGVFAGGYLVARLGILRALLIGGIIQAATNIFFVALAVVGYNLPLLVMAISTDNFAGGVGTAALVAYLSSLTNKSHTATQYALLTSMMASGRTFLSSGSGFVAEYMGWFNFFVLSIIMAIPALIILKYLGKNTDHA